MTKKKTIDVLVIDDLQKNIDSAKTLMKDWNENGELMQRKEWVVENGLSPKLDIPFNEVLPTKYMNLSEKVSADYAMTGEEALNLVNENNYDIVLSDVFFNYDEKGTPGQVRNNLKEMLGPYGVLNGKMLGDVAKRSFSRNKWNEEAKKWYEGRETPPLGAHIAKSYFEKNPKGIYVFNTNVYHHNKLAEPVSNWRVGMRDQEEYKMEYIDSNGRDGTGLPFKKGGDTSTEESKDWRRAMLAGLNYQAKDKE